MAVQITCTISMAVTMQSQGRLALLPGQGNGKVLGNTPERAISCRLKEQAPWSRISGCLSAVHQQPVSVVAPVQAQRL